ncbi:MAG: TRAP transporter small permease [Alphaproteobacteria bacterium]|nr:TRAP transporter small permease [Alphaproteobacteria bacterium]
MKSPLYRLYWLCGVLGGAFMVMLLGFVVLGIVMRFIPALYLRGTDSYAGYCMAASAFLALAYTFGHGEHIRVTLLIQRFTGGARRALEIWCLILAVLLSGFFAFYSCKMAWWSWKFHDISQAHDATPLWIPQLGMAVGTAVLFVAVVEEFFMVLRGQSGIAEGPAAGEQRME